MSAIDVFTSYSHKDEALRDEFANHLKVLQREGIIKAWYDREISAGSEWEKQIRRNLRRARIILLLISADFIASDYCWDVEVKTAMNRHRTGRCRVIPIILRRCNWEQAPFGRLQALPEGAKPVTEWENRDEAFANITQSIRDTAVSLGARTGRLARIGTTVSNLKAGTLVFICALTLLLLLFFHGLLAPRIAVGLIENAKFGAATHYLEAAHWLAFFNSKVDRISQRLNNPLSLQVSLILRRPNRPFPEAPYPFNATEDNRLVITPNDYFKLSIETTPSQFYLYIFETDLDYGMISRLFPPESSLDRAVLIRNTSLLNIPPGDNKWRRLTQHTQKAATTKTIHVLASPWRAKDVESYFAEIIPQIQSQTLSRDERQAAIDNLLSKIYLRTDSNIECFFYSHLSFRHADRDSPEK